MPLSATEILPPIEDVAATTFGTVNDELSRSKGRKSRLEAIALGIGEGQKLLLVPALVALSLAETHGQSHKEEGTHETAEAVCVWAIPSDGDYVGL